MRLAPKACLSHATLPLINELQNKEMQDTDPPFEASSRPSYHSLYKEKGFGKVSMGNEMGNNNTSALKEEDNTSEAEKNAFNEDVHADSVEDESQRTLVAKGEDADTKAAGLASNDTMELQNQTSEEDIHADGVKVGNQTMPVVEAKDVMLKAVPVSDDAIVVAEKDTLQEVSHKDDVRRKNQLIPTPEAEDVRDKATEMDSENPITVGKDSLEEDTRSADVKVENEMEATAVPEDVQEKTKVVASDNTKRTLGKDSLEGDTHAGDVENKKHQTAEPGNVPEKAEGMAFDDTTRLERASLEGDIRAGDLKFENHMHPTSEPKDTPEEAKGLASINKTTLEKDSLEGDTSADYVRVENEKIPTAETEDAQERAIALASDDTTSSFGKDSLEGDAGADVINIEHQMHPKAEGKNVEGKAARLTLAYATRELQDHKPQEDTHANEKQGQIYLIPLSKGIYVKGQATQLDSDVPLNVTDSSGSELQETTGVKKPDISHYTGSVEAGGQGGEILSQSLLKGTEEYEKQSSLKKSLQVTYDHKIHNFDKESSIKQVPTEEEQTMILTLADMSRSNDAEPQESGDIHSNHNELVNVLSESSLQSNELLQITEVVDNSPHCQESDDVVFVKEMKTLEKNCGNKFDGMYVHEFGGGLRDKSAATSDSPKVGNSSNAALLARVNYITDEILNLLSESALVDVPLDFHQGEKCMTVYDDNKEIKGGSKMENGYHYNLGQCYEEPVKEKRDTANTDDMTRGSNGDLIEERNLVLPSRIPGIGNTHQVKEPKFMENGHKIDVHVNNHSKTSDEISTVSQLVFLDPKAEVDPFITGTTVLYCRHEEGEQNQNTISEEKDQKPEASYARGKSFEGSELSGQCISHTVSTDLAKSFALDTSASFIQICSYQQGNLNHTKTCTDMATSDLKRADDNSLSITVDKLDSSNLTAARPHLINGEAFQQEGEDDFQQIEATSSKGGEKTTSAATLFNEAYSSISAFTNGGYEANGSMTRLSTESNSDNPNISVHIQKSPSFNLNLRIEAKAEESNHMPRLYQDKTENESLSSQSHLNIMNSTLYAENGQCKLQHEKMPMEEKIVTMERSYSQKSKPLFLGLLKEDEEARFLVTPQKEDNHADTKNAVKEVRSTSPKGKKKRRPSSSFFSSCMCCATVTN